MEPSSPNLTNDLVRIGINEVLLRCSSRKTYGVRIALNGNAFDFEPFQKEVSHKWTTPRVTLKLHISELKRSSDARIQILNSKRKIIGSTILPLSDLTKSHGTYDSTKEDNVYVAQLDKNKAVSVVIKSEAFSPAHFLSLLNDQAELLNALRDLESLAKSKEYSSVSKATSYLSEELLKMLWLHVDQADPNILTPVLCCLYALCDNQMTRKKLLHLNIVESFCKVLEPSLPGGELVQPGILSCLRPFFSTPKSQQYLLQHKVDSLLVHLISPRTPEQTILALFDTFRYFDPSSIGALIKTGILKRVFKLYTHNATCSSSMVLKLIDLMFFIGSEFRDDIVQSSVAGLFPWFISSHPDAFVRLKLIEAQRTFSFQVSVQSELSSPSVAAALVKSYDPLADGSTKLRTLEELRKETLINDVNEPTRLSVQSGAIKLFAKCLTDLNPLVFDTALSYFECLKGFRLDEIASSGYVDSLKAVVLNPKTPPSSCTKAADSLCSFVRSDRVLSSKYDLSPALSAVIGRESLDLIVRFRTLYAMLEADSRTMYEVLISNRRFQEIIKIVASEAGDDWNYLWPFFCELMAKVLSHRPSAIDSALSRHAPDPPNYVDETGENLLLEQFESYCKNIAVADHLVSGAPNALKFSISVLPIVLEYPNSLLKTIRLIASGLSSVDLAKAFVGDGGHHALLEAHNRWKGDPSKISENVLSTLTGLIQPQHGPLFESEFAERLIFLLMAVPLENISDSPSYLSMWKSLVSHEKYIRAVVDTGAAKYLLDGVSKTTDMSFWFTISRLIDSLLETLARAGIQEFTLDPVAMSRLAEYLFSAPVPNRHIYMRILSNFLHSKSWRDHHPDIQKTLNTSFFVERLPQLLAVDEPTTAEELTSAAWNLFEYFISSVQPQLEEPVPKSNLISAVDRFVRACAACNTLEQATKLMLQLLIDTPPPSSFYGSLMDVLKVENWSVTKPEHRYITCMLQLAVAGFSHNPFPNEDVDMFRSLWNRLLAISPPPFESVATYLEKRQRLIAESPDSTTASRDRHNLAIDPCLPTWNDAQMFSYSIMLQSMKLLSMFSSNLVMAALRSLTRFAPRTFGAPAPLCTAPLAAAFIDCALRVWTENNHRMDETMVLFCDPTHKDIIALSDDPEEFLPALKYDIYIRKHSFEMALLSEPHATLFKRALQAALTNVEIAISLCRFLFPLPFHSVVPPESLQLIQMVRKNHASNLRAIAAARRLEARLEHLQNVNGGNQLDNIVNLIGSAPPVQLYQSAEELLRSVDFSFLDSSDEEESGTE